MFEEKGDRPYANEDLYAGGLPDVWGVCAAKDHDYQKGTLLRMDSASCGIAGKGIEVLDRRDSGYRRAEQEDPGNALPGIRAAGRAGGLPDSAER